MQRGDIAQLHAHGAAGYLAKPFTLGATATAGNFTVSTAAIVAIYLLWPAPHATSLDDRYA